MRIPRPASMIRAALGTCRSFGPAIALALVLTACGGGGSGADFSLAALTTPPVVGNTTPAADDPPDNPPAPPVQPVVSCADLNGKSLPASLISLPTQGATITSATPVAAADAGNLLGDYCRVRGTIQPVDANASVAAASTAG
jgi:hypothetical protein